MTTATGQNGSWIRAGLGVLLLFTGLCSIFAAVATAVEAWQERAQAQWPEVTARVDQCGLIWTTNTGGPTSVAA